MSHEGTTRFDREKAVVFGGHWAHMSPLERGVWFVLLMHSDFKSGVVTMPREKLSELSGCSNLNRMRDAIRRLEANGLSETLSDGGGQGKAATRRMLSPKPFWNSPLFDQAEGIKNLATLNESDGGGDVEVGDEWGQRGPVTGPVREFSTQAKGAGQRHLTGPVRDVKGAGERTHTGPVSGPPYHISHQISPPPHIRPDRQTGPGPLPHPPLTLVSTTRTLTVEEEEVRKFLMEKGLWESSAKKFARLVLIDEAKAIWKAIVNDGAVKKKHACLAVRLKEHVQENEGDNGNSKKLPASAAAS